MARRWALWIYVGYRCYYSYISSHLYLLASSLSVVILFKSMRTWKMVRVGNRLSLTPTRQVIIWMSKLARKSSNKYLPDTPTQSFMALGQQCNVNSRRAPVHAPSVSIYYYASRPPGLQVYLYSLMHFDPEDNTAGAGDQAIHTTRVRNLV